MVLLRVFRHGLVAGVLLLAVIMSPVAAPPTPQSPLSSDAAAQWELVTTYCVQCHNSKVKTAGVALDALKPPDIPQHAELFEKVARKLRGRMMPPPGQSRPAEARYDSFVTWLEGTLDRAAAAKPHPGRVVVHRLNRREYANAVQDLFALKIDPAEILPEDDRSDGFDNIASALHTSPTFFNQYVAAARSVAVQAVGKPNPGPGSQAYFL